MNLKEATLRAAVIKLLMEKLTAADKVGRIEGLGLFLEARDSHGLKSTEVRLEDGTLVANATLPQPKDSIEFVDDAFLAYVEAERPDEIVKLVNPAFSTAIKRHLTVEGDAVVDTRTGEVVEWARVRPAGQPKNFTITFTRDGRDAIAQAWQDAPETVLEFLAPPELVAPADEDNDMDLAALLEQRAGMREAS